MSDNGMQAFDNTDKWINWIEGAITEEYFKHYKYEHFRNIKLIGIGKFGRVFRANWKNAKNYVALKSFFNLDITTAKEIVNELKLQREVDFHDNIIRFYGITKFESVDIIGQTKEYLLVMEYADGGTLRNYLKENFSSLTWDDKYKLAYQLACSVSCLHDEEIIHRDLHSCNVLVHQNSIKLADFGLSKRINEASNPQLKLFGMVPYVDPKVLSNSKTLKLNEKSDVYSIGVLLWEISSGIPPFHEENYDLSLINKIVQGRREVIVPDTPIDYSNLYTECWSNEPSERPLSIHEVVNRLKIFIPNSINTTIYQEDKITQTNLISNENPTSNNTENLLNGELSQIIQNFNNMNTDEIDNVALNANISSEEKLSTMVNEMVDLIFRKLTKESKLSIKRQYLSDNNVILQEVYNWLLNNQNDLDSIFLLGYFNYVGIETSQNFKKAFSLFIYTSEQDHILAQYFVGECYQHGYGITNDEKLAYEYFKKLADDNYAMGQFKMGYFFKNGIGVKKDSNVAAHWYEKAANNGNIVAMHNLGSLYLNGNRNEYLIAMHTLNGSRLNGIDFDEGHSEAFKLFKRSAEEGYSSGITMLGYCYEIGIGINVDKQKAVELYQTAANLGHMVAQYNLANMYENGEGIEKDIERSIYWFEKSVEQGYLHAKNKLKNLRENRSINLCNIS
ncbi:hypothetical protein RclHR1_18310002 [Rhizophagus clarus]|uniref:Kinase-like domain-containing protein n=1 Tax=Rhizophagus clarus TaxID=94130 RepID=A0A2Z6R0N6_9GLOM|nr:hypothetical protein RclHR1_18310002 [Rhizophagus clarus]GES87997.1 kinase-like domain-containing protein [Rhizophagus clarus]